MLALVLAAALTSATPQEAWTRAEMTADLEQLVGAVRQQWSYLEDRTENNGLNLEALHATSLEALDEVHSRSDFANVLRRFVAVLEDGHGSVKVEDGEAQRRYLLLELAACAEGVVVTAADQDSATGARLPTAGDLLVSIEGRSVDELLTALETTTSSSSPGQRRARALEALIYTTAEELEVELQDSAGQQHRVRLHSRAWPLVPERNNWELTWPAEGVALLRIESFAVKDWEAWLAAPHEEREPFLVATHERIAEVFVELEEHAARGLIIDVRGNGGGTDALGHHLVQYLVTEPFVYFRLSNLTDAGWRKPGGLTYRTEPGMRAFEGPVVALIDAGCFSTTDNFLRAMDDLRPHFTTVGRATGAGTGAPRVIATLEHSGARITLCTMRVLGPKSGLTEGRGTRPDVPVTWTREDVSAGRDPDLEAALRVLD